MVYLIAQLAGWLLLTAAFAALAGWSFAAWRSAAADAKARRDRANLMRDLIALVGENGNGEDALELEREREAARRLSEVREGRIAELERALEAARASADESGARSAELQRALEAMEAEREEAAAAAMDVEHEQVEEPALSAPAQPEEDLSLLTWRLRYFEQRVRYLESAERAVEEAAPALAEPKLAEWRARVAELRAQHAEDEVRTLTAPLLEETAREETAPEEDQASPFAANADVDVLLRWRMLYLERRVAHLQARAGKAQALSAPSAEEPQTAMELEASAEDEAPAQPPGPDVGPDPECWKWRARYLEARARQLEQRLVDADARAEAAAQRAAAQLAAQVPESQALEEEAQLAPAPAARRVKPSVLQAPRHGAPDDLTLIDGVSLLQQTTFYSLGVFHYDQIAAWSDENVAWIDNYLRLRGRIDHEEWREQAAALAREGPLAARRILAEEV